MVIRLVVGLPFSVESKNFYFSFWEFFPSPMFLSNIKRHSWYVPRLHSYIVKYRLFFINDEPFRKKSEWSPQAYPRMIWCLYLDWWTRTQYFTRNPNIWLSLSENYGWGPARVNANFNIELCKLPISVALKSRLTCPGSTLYTFYNSE